MLRKDCGRRGVSRPCYYLSLIHMCDRATAVVQDVPAVIPRTFLSLRGVPVKNMTPWRSFPVQRNITRLKSRTKFGRCSGDKWRPSRLLSNLGRTQLVLGGDGASADVDGGALSCFSFHPEMQTRRTFELERIAILAWADYEKG
jgi:hypothetical protein